MKVEVRGKPKICDPYGYVISLFPHLKIVMIFNKKKKPCRALQYLIFLHPIILIKYSLIFILLNN